MATIKCTIQEYHRFIGPIIRNKINSFARNIRNEKNGICEFCKEKKILEAAHIHGRGRKYIIESILEHYITNDDFIEGDLLEIEIKILNAHQPIESAFIFLCKNCHKEYDKNEVGKNKVLKKNSNKSDLENNNFKKLNRIKLWAKKEGQINHTIIKAFLEISKSQKVTFDNLKKKCTSEYTIIKPEKFYGHIQSMKSDNSNSHGKVFFENNGYIEIYPTVMNEINKYFK